VIVEDGNFESGIIMPVFASETVNRHKLERTSAELNKARRRGSVAVSSRLASNQGRSGRENFHLRLATSRKRSDRTHREQNSDFRLRNVAFASLFGSTPNAKDVLIPVSFVAFYVNFLVLSFPRHRSVKATEDEPGYTQKSAKNTKTGRLCKLLLLCFIC
jgi:hypothetical protein